MKIYLDDGRYVNVNIRKNERGNTYEYDINGILIGAYRPGTTNKFFEIDLEKYNTIENELSAEVKDKIKQIIPQIKSQIEQIPKEKIEEEAMENKEIEEYLQEIDIEQKNIKDIKVINLKESEEKSEKESKKENEKENEEKEEKVITSKDINIKQEINLDERATDMQNLRAWLGGQIPNDIKKLVVIESYEMSKFKDENGKNINKPSTRYSLGVMGKDGKVEPLKKYIPQLEQNYSSGNNPTENKYQINTDGQVEKDAVLSEYRIGSKIMQLDKDAGDNLEVNIGKYSPFGNELVTTRMRDKNTTFASSKEVRKAAMGHFDGVYDNKNSYKEAQEHEEAGDKPEELTINEIDGDKNTGHEHFTQEEINRCVDDIMKNDDINETFTRKEVEQRLLKNIFGKNSDMENINKEDVEKAKVETIEKVKSDTEKELAEDTVHMKNFH